MKISLGKTLTDFASLKDSLCIIVTGIGPFVLGLYQHHTLIFIQKHITVVLGDVVPRRYQTLGGFLVSVWHWGRSLSDAGCQTDSSRRVPQGDPTHSRIVKANIRIITEKITPCTARVLGTRWRNCEWTNEDVTVYNTLN